MVIKVQFPKQGLPRETKLRVAVFLLRRDYSFLSDCRHHYTALYTVYCDAMIINYSSNNFLDIIEPD